MSATSSVPMHRLKIRYAVRVRLAMNRKNISQIVKLGSLMVGME